MAAVLYEHPDFFKTPGVEQQFNPLSGGELAFGVLRFDSISPPAQKGFAPELFEFFYSIHPWTVFFCVRKIRQLGLGVFKKTLRSS
jgi:hypothetical protein